GVVAHRAVPCRSIRQPARKNSARLPRRLGRRALFRKACTRRTSRPRIQARSDCRGRGRRHGQPVPGRLPPTRTLTVPTEALSHSVLDSSTGTAELLVDGFSTKIARSHQEPRVLVCPSSIGLSSRTLRCLTGRLAARRGKIGTDPMATSDRRLSDSARLAHL